MIQIACSIGKLWPAAISIVLSAECMRLPAGRVRIWNNSATIILFLPLIDGGDDAICIDTAARAHFTVAVQAIGEAQPRSERAHQLHMAYLVQAPRKSQSCRTFTLHSGSALRVMNQVTERCDTRLQWAHVSTPCPLWPPYPQCCSEHRPTTTARPRFALKAARRNQADENEMCGDIRCIHCHSDR
jgi:hypothetical protein